MNESVSVKFVKHYRQYNVGDIAGFSDHIAKRLVDDEIAVYNRGKGRPIGSKTRVRVTAPAGEDWVDKSVVQK